MAAFIFGCSTILDESRELFIKPSNINISEDFYDSFRHHETAISARWIVRLIQSKGDVWTSFTREEIEALYKENGLHDFSFNRLISEGFIVEKDNKLFPTLEFVTRCFSSAPLPIEALRAV